MGKFFQILGLVIPLLVLSLSLRGLPGNPSTSQLNSPHWRGDGPFELSPERGRFALLYSLIEDKSFYFSTPLARFIIPDLGYAKGRYVSLFAPAVSFLVSPGYLIGRYLGISQVGAFFIISLFAVANLYLVKRLSRALGASESAATLSGLIFLFATPAFAYAVNLYQHHISTFLMLGIIYIALKPQNFKTLFLVSFLYAASISVDYPNAIMFAPAFLYAFSKSFSITKTVQKMTLNINVIALLGIVGAAIPTGFFLWSNYQSYGDPFQLAGTIRSANYLDARGTPVTKEQYIKSQGKEAEIAELTRQKTTTGFFKSRNLVNGLYIHLISPDRGILTYTPIIILGFLGVILVLSQNYQGASLLIATLGANFILYSMWGDPWGGWAFGSRYLIPGYALLAVFLSIVVTKFHRNIVFLLLFFCLSAFSLGVNTLGAITTSAIPPQVEVLNLEQLSGRQERYSWDRNWEFLNSGKSKSYIYQTFLRNKLTSINFYYVVLGLIGALYLINLIKLVWQK